MFGCFKHKLVWLVLQVSDRHFLWLSLNFVFLSFTSIVKCITLIKIVVVFSYAWLECLIGRWQLFVYSVFRHTKTIASWYNTHSATILVQKHLCATWCFLLTWKHCFRIIISAFNFFQTLIVCTQLVF